MNLARRQRRRRGLPPAAPRRRRLPFPINLIWNVKAFYLTFIFATIASLAAVGLAPGLGGSSNNPPPPIEDSSPVAEETASGIPVFEAPEDTIDVAKNYQAVIATNEGQIVLALSPDAPEAANSFAFLAGQNFFDGQEFFWVLPGFNAQAGDPTCTASDDAACTGSAGPGYTLPRESDSATVKQWSVIAPVTTPGGDQVHGSQFVIALADESDFEGSILGTVVSGQDILDGLQERTPCFGGQPTDSNPCQTGSDLPDALVIENVTVQPAG